MSADLRVDWCSYEAAKYAVEHWHYSRCMPQGRYNVFGVWENDTFIGCVVYGFSISPQLGVQFGLTQHEVTELKRVALSAHTSPVSRVLRISRSLLVTKNDKLRLIISFADTMQSHIGAIYQADNWVYTGLSTPMTQVLIGGRWRNDTHANAEKKWSAVGKREIPGKHRYLYPLDRAMRKQIEPLRKPYPKRETCGPSVEGDTPPQTESDVRSIGAAFDMTGREPVLVT